MRYKKGDTTYALIADGSGGSIVLNKPAQLDEKVCCVIYTAFNNKNIDLDLEVKVDLDGAEDLVVGLLSFISEHDPEQHRIGKLRQKIQEREELLFWVGAQEKLLIEGKEEKTDVSSWANKGREPFKY